MSTRNKPNMSAWVPDVPSLKEILPNVELLEEDGIPLETFWHFDQMMLLIALLNDHWRDRDDFCVGGNQFIYYSVDQARDIAKDPLGSKAYRGPDFFYVSDVTRHKPRKHWVVWEEGGRFPDVIVELLSPKTKKNDRTVKKEIYENIFHTSEYYLFDPATWKLDGWRLLGSYQAIPLDKRGWAWSEMLGLWLGPWKGTYHGTKTTWLRFYDAEGRLIPLAEERAAEEKQRAEAEKQRADAAEVEVAHLKARLGEGGKKKNGR